MANSVHRKSKPNFILSAIFLTPLLLTPLMGCSTAARNDESNKRDQKVQSLESDVKTLSTKVAELQAQLTVTREQLDLTRSSNQNEQLVGGHTPGGKITVVPHPADGAGMSIDAEKSDQDPESGFVEDGAVKLYRKSLILFKGQKYSEAVMGMSSFLDHYADHALAGSAQYYIGESYYRKNEFKLAKEELERLLSAYDRSPMVPAALARLIEIEESQKDIRAANSHKQMLLSMYPNSPAAAGIHYQIEKVAPPAPVKSPESSVTVPGAAAPVGLDQPPQSADLEKIDHPTKPVTPVVEGVDAVPAQEATPSFQ